MKLSTHLNFGGNCEEAFRYYERHLGGTITQMLKQSQIQPNAAADGPNDLVIHARISLAGVELIANDVPADRFQPIRSSYLYLALDSSADAERAYRVLSEGGKVTMPLAETFFASRFAQLRDQFGVLWTVLSPKE